MSPRLVFGLLLLLGGLARAAEPRPLLAHAHNDYEHPRPLLDALDRGFDSVEADVWLVDGELLVAHDRRDVRPGRDLRTLYLEPLRARVRAGGGAVHPGRPGFVLLVDVKSAATPTYLAVAAALADYAEMLTEFVEGREIQRAVTVILSGNRDEAALRAAPRRWVAMDGRRTHLDSAWPVTLIPWISENWRTFSSWHWTGPMPEEVRRNLGDWVARAQARGRRLRFWNVPDSPAAWRELRAAGVDVIGADDLAGLEAFLARP
jgi:hypothetical protein